MSNQEFFSLRSNASLMICTYEDSSLSYTDINKHKGEALTAIAAHTRSCHS
jgi:hypothetical protein